LAKENMKSQKRIDTVPGTPASIRASRLGVRGKIRTTPVPPEPQPKKPVNEDERETIPVPGMKVRGTRESHERLSARSETVEPRGETRDPRREEEDDDAVG